MKNNLPLIALGAVGLFLIVSKKPTTKSTTKKDEPKSEPGKEPNEGKPQVELELDIPQIKTCSINEYYDANKATCIEFWNDNTEAAVLKKFDDVLKQKNLQKDVGKICAEIKVGENYQQNPIALDIIKKTVSELWKIPLDLLPPKKSNPNWVLTVWSRVYDLYYKSICNFETGWN